MEIYAHIDFWCCALQIAHCLATEACKWCTLCSQKACGLEGYPAQSLIYGQKEEENSDIFLRGSCLLVRGQKVFFDNHPNSFHNRCVTSTVSIFQQFSVQVEYSWKCCKRIEWHGWVGVLCMCLPGSGHCSSYLGNIVQIQAVVFGRQQAGWVSKLSWQPVAG